MLNEYCDQTKQILAFVVTGLAFSVMMTAEKRKEYSDQTKTLLTRLKTRESEFVKIQHKLESTLLHSKIPWITDKDVNKSKELSSQGKWKVGGVETWTSNHGDPGMSSRRRLQNRRQACWE